MPKQELILGFELGTNSVKLVLIDTTKPALVAGGIEQLSTAQLSDTIYVDAIKKLLADHIVTTKKVVSVISSSNEKAGVYLMKLPVMSHKELLKTIRWELSSKVNFDISEPSGCAIDYLSFGEIIDDGIKKVELAVYILDKTVIEKQLAIFNQSGLSVTKIVPEVICLLNLLPADKIAALVNINRKTTDILICENRVLKLVRSILIGGNNFTEALSQSTAVSYQDAETKKITDGIDFEIPFVKPLIRRFISEIKRSFDYYHKLFPNKIISTVILTGGASKLKQLDSYLADNLAVEVKYPDFSSILQFTQPQQSTQPLMLSGLLGLSKEIDINLLPEKLKPKKIVINQNFVYAASSAILLIIAFIIYLLPYIIIKKYKTKIAATQILIKQKEQTVADLKAEIQTAKQQQQQLELAEKLINTNPVFYPVIYELIQKTAQGIILEKLTLSNEKINLCGSSSSNELIITYISKLERSQVLKSVELKHIQKKDTGFDFEIGCNLHK